MWPCREASRATSALRTYSGEGSGVIFSSDGMIVTNNHVVSENDVPVTDIVVTLATGEKLPATIVGRDPLTDLAVIKIEKTGLTPATFVQDMTTVKVGQYAIAIGSPLGYSNSVTMGIVSGLQRDLASLAEAQDAQAYIDLIQTDAAISPGNSGGALVNAAGAGHGHQRGLPATAGYGRPEPGFRHPGRRGAADRRAAHPDGQGGAPVPGRESGDGDRRPAKPVQPDPSTRASSWPT